MNRIRSIRRWVALALAAAALIVLAISRLGAGTSSHVESAAQEMGRKVEKRLNILEGYIQKTLKEEDGGWTAPSRLKKDMVVYRYAEDTLQSWAGQFPIRSDDIRPRTLVQRLGESRSNASSPLADVTQEWSYMNLGPKWYLIKAVQGEDDVKVIAGLEIVDELKAGSINGINRHLRADQRYSVMPLSASAGAPVIVFGQPLFKLSAENLAEPSQRHSTLVWLSIALLLGAGLLYLSSRPSALWMGIIIAVQGGLLLWLYLYGHNLAQSSQLFSPLLYADGSLLYSLGAVIIINLAIILVVADVYLVRWSLLKAVLRTRSKVLEGVLSGVIVVVLAGIMLYFHLAFRSIIINSNITLELYKIALLSPYTGIVYASFLVLSLSIPLLLQMLSPLVRSLTGLRYNMFSGVARVGFALTVGFYFVIITSTLGFRKEQQRVEVWANRLSMDRDIALEIQLRLTENAISGDAVIGALSAMEGNSDLIRSRLVSAYMGRISQDYDIGVLNPGQDYSAALIFQDRIRGGVQLGENSHFFYSTIGGGRTAYTGLFTYYVQDYGPSSILITVESKHNREDRGYLSLLGIADPGRISLPPVYSWAKYTDDRLLQYKGSYPYPTVNSGRLKEVSGHMDMDGWCHFAHDVSDEERIVISRPSTEWLYYVVEGFLFAILAFLLLSALGRQRRRVSGRRYYQTRIGLVVYVSLIATLVAMAGFSVWFVYKRNNADMQSIMTARINTLQAMLQEHLRQVEDPSGMDSPDVPGAVDEVGNNLRCDITLFDTGGRMIVSTTPEVYDRMILGRRLDDDAYRNIRYGYKRFYMHSENVGRRKYYALYAPVMNSNGQMLGIISSPFTDITHDLETEAILHIATVITIFLLLLLAARFITFGVVAGMFRPITELRRKMTVTDVDHLEPLEYDQDDEITPLVQAYNRMVKDLGESSRRLAQVERDKAWTDMARRVAHDLKNPLTPIKLQLQMLMRMKTSGNPAWQERFDEVAQTVLYHVDLLADSADQFSTFAKMYDQSPERLDLDALVRQEVDLFDSRDDVSLEYYGLSGAYVRAPRPQLTRVVVNLLTNAIQAVEDIPGERRMIVALRNSVDDGFYEIVVEDNGPGVSEQNQDKIFTPDFTTKTSGSGLGLAICRRIVEHCGGSISYSRSFALGGACFTVKYPKD